MIFHNRADAGRQLAERLAALDLEAPLVFALPRGGVVVGYEVAKALGAPLDVIVARKVGAPFQPELGVGAVAPGGVTLLDERAIRDLHIPPQTLQAAVERERAEMERRLRLYRGDAAWPEVSGRTVLLVDDGLATGVTARAALESLLQGQPGRVILAVPVGAPISLAEVEALGVEVVRLSAPTPFQAVGAHYEAFDQTSDEEVMRRLALARDRFAERDQPNS